MKYIIDLPEEFAEATKEYWEKTVGMQLEPYTELDCCKSIEDEVWELANYMGRMSLTERDLCFGFPLPQEVTMNLSYQEAKAKYEAWVKKKNEIHVGDEVIYHRNKYIVGYVGEDEVYHLVDQCWLRVIVQGNYQLIKTGRHFDEVEELLKKIKEV